MSPRRRERIVTLAVFFAVLIPHSLSLNRTSWDSRWTVYTALSLIREGNIDLDEYRPMLEKNGMLSTYPCRGHVYNWYPPGPVLLSVPFVWVMDRAYALAGEDYSATIAQRTPHKFEGVIASFLVAITSVLIYRIARMRLAVKGSLLVVLVFAFCTPVWSSASRAMWTHTPSILMLTTALWMISGAMLRAKSPEAWHQKKPIFAGLAGLPLAFSLLCRPTNAIPAGLLAFYVLLKHPRQVPLFVACGAAVIGPFLYFNWQTYGTLLPDYYFLARSAPGTQFWEAFAGHLISPSRGLLIASPILALVPVGVWLKIRRREFGLLDALLLVAIALHWVLISSWCNWWWGGHSLGPRLWTDMIPFLTWFLIPVAGAIVPSEGKPRRPALVLAGVLVVASFLAHASLSNNPAAPRWNPVPVNVDQAPWRLWEWHDVQFLRR